MFLSVNHTSHVVLLTAKGLPNKKQEAIIAPCSACNHSALGAFQIVAGW
jgi:hypothetical protein